LLSTTPRKRGRPLARYRCADGAEISELTRRADGRWRIAATEETFYEPDENPAIGLPNLLTIVAAQEAHSESVLVDIAGPDIGAAVEKATQIVARMRRRSLFVARLFRCERRRSWGTR
jgi:hypothetical protein